MKYQFALYAVIIMGSCCTKKNENPPAVYVVDEAGSAIEWKGAAPDHYHVGAFSVSGNMHADANGNITTGKFNIPVASIKNFDLPDTIRPQLLDHLKSPDFFNMALYPNAGFEIEAVGIYHSPSPDTTHIIRGAFTMLGTTRTISFPAKIMFKDDSITAKAGFSIDRLKWGMTGFNDPQKELYIYPEVEIKLDIRAAKL